MSRTSPRGLLVAVLVAASSVALVPAVGVSAEEPPAPTLADLPALERQLQEANRAQDRARAVEVTGRMVGILGERHAELLFDLARLHMLAGRKVESFQWLKRAAGAGFWDVSRPRQDPAFAAVAQEPLFRELCRGIWANGYLAMLEREERREFQKPDEVMKALALRPGERVADIGAGSGYFTLPVARAVGPTGKVWALDIRQEMLDFIDLRVRGEGLTNVELRKVEPDDPRLPKGEVDTVLMVDVLHYVEERTAYAARVKEGLAPGGRLVVIDYKPKPMSERPWGPLPGQQVSRERMDADLAAAGLEVARAFDFLPEQYFVVYTPRKP